MNDETIETENETNFVKLYNYYDEIEPNEETMPYLMAYYSGIESDEFLY